MPANCRKHPIAWYSRTDQDSRWTCRMGASPPGRTRDPSFDPHHVLIGNDYFLPGDALVPKALVPDTLLHARNVCPDIHVEYRLETIAQEPERDVPGPPLLLLKKLDPLSPFLDRQSVV